jgi:hypothetical protein
MMYDIGDTVRLTCTFTNLSGTGTNPTAVTFRLKSPAGTVTTPTPSSSGSGVYYTDVNLSSAGEWRYEFAGTGAVVAASAGSIVVRKSKFS